MSSLLYLLWAGAGIIFAIAGKPFIEVAACFLVAGIFLGAANVYDLKCEMKKDYKEIIDILKEEKRD